MSDNFLCVMAGYDKDTEEYLASIQNALYAAGFTGTHTKNIPQHITLGTYSVDRETELVTLVRRVATETKMFSVSFNHIGIFGGSKVLFIAPDPDRNLLTLKERFGDSRHWTPHTTMLIDQPDTICAALPIVAEQFSAFVGEVQSIYVYEFWPTRHIISLSLAPSVLNKNLL